jgi:hypothetical protein
MTVEDNSLQLASSKPSPGANDLIFVSQPLSNEEVA